MNATLTVKAEESLPPEAVLSRVPEAIKKRRWRVTVVDGVGLWVPQGIARSGRAWLVRPGPSMPSRTFSDGAAPPTQSLWLAIDDLVLRYKPSPPRVRQPAKAVTPVNERSDSRFIKRRGNGWSIAVPFTNTMYMADKIFAGDPERSYVCAVETRDWLLRKVAESGIKLGRRAKTTTKVDKPVEEIGIWRRYDTQGRFRSVDAAYSRGPGRIVSKTFKGCDFGFNEEATVKAAIEWREAGIERATKERPIDIRAPRVFLPGASRN